MTAILGIAYLALPPLLVAALIVRSELRLRRKKRDTTCDTTSP